jgi:transcriptional regulator with XRE-family HTH domain
MNAREARERRGGSTLVDRIQDADPKRATRIKKLVAQADAEQRVEHMVQAIMASQSVSAAELARRLNSKAPQISRELSGGLNKSTLKRITVIADALGYEFLPTFVPRENSAKRKRFMKAYQTLLLTADPKPVSKRVRKKTARKPTKLSQPTV